MKSKKPIYIVLLSVILVGCEKNNDDHVYTLYSSYQISRAHEATFDATPNSWKDKKIDEQFKQWYTEDNFKNCNKVAELLTAEWYKTVKTAEIKY